MSVVGLRGARRALLPTAVILTVALGTFAGVLVQTPIAVPLSRSAERLWPLACLAAVPAGVWCTEAGHRWLEVAAGRSRQVRAGLAVLVVVLAAVGIALGAAWPSSTALAARHLAEVGRNFGLVLGCTLAAGRTIGSELCWTPGVALVLGCWLIGSPQPGRPPATWAITLQPIDHAPAALTATIAAVVGVGWFVSGRSC